MLFLNFASDEFTYVCISFFSIGHFFSTTGLTGYSTTDACRSIIDSSMFCEYLSRDLARIGFCLTMRSAALLNVSFWRGF